MGVLRKEYNLESHVDEVWYESSNVVYSKFEEDAEENTGNLYVVFKGGKQYLYEKVTYADYLSFKGAFVDGSSGKALNEYIIKKYKGEKVDDADITELQNRLMSQRDEETTYFIHGPSDYDRDILLYRYIPTIEYFIELSSDSRFITTLYDRFGYEAVMYMVTQGVDPGKFTLYMKKSDEATYILIPELADCNTVMIKDKEWNDDFVRQQMRVRSTDDIAYVSPDDLEKIKEISPSAYNIIIRRFE